MTAEKTQKKMTKKKKSGLAAAKTISMDALVAAVLAELDGIFTVGNIVLLYFHMALARVRLNTMAYRDLLPMLPLAPIRSLELLLPC